ncbi:MAG: PEP-utilizing enzyme [Ignavibacteriales bacterium]|nr:PEP-utilizing enzyme [Ignavibacteriales bacterium]
MNSKNNKINAIILGAGSNPEKQYVLNTQPKTLLSDQEGYRVLDWILAAFNANNVNEITFVGGYQIDMIGKKYPGLNYVYNPEWDKSGVLESLYHGRRNIKGSLLISYADIVYYPNVVRKLIENSSDAITIAIDSNWKQKIRKGQSISKNLVLGSLNSVTDIGFLNISENIIGEFIGLAYLSEKCTGILSEFLNIEYPKFLRQPFEQANDIKNGFLTDLLRYLIKQKNNITAVDIGKEWKEIDSAGGLVRFVLGTKSQTLSRLSLLLKKGLFCKQEYFTVGMWKKNPDEIVAAISKMFSPEKIAIRSSAINEDSFEESLAGAFESVLNVDSKNPQQIYDSVKKVVLSYDLKGNNYYLENQILVQQMVKNVVMSGVIFTRDIETGAPYYIINYDDTSEITDSVTSGRSNHFKTVLVNRYSPIYPENIGLKKLLEAVKEIEEIVNYDSLDIEFAIDNHESIYILQVRPITKSDEFDKSGFLSDNSSAIVNIKSFLQNKFNHTSFLFGDKTIFADMSDWNPAEMIGIHPKQLAYTLYDYLIMKSAWRISRARIGYKDVSPANLMVNIMGHPYVDVRNSFNSFLPADLEPSLSKKIVNEYLVRLSNNPDLHDKVEFEICFTCLDFNFDNKFNAFYQNSFSLNEIKKFKGSLFALTNNIISGKFDTIEILINKVKQLELLRKIYSSDISDTSRIPSIINIMLNSCIELGTIPFSILARYAFIGNSMLQSLVERDALSLERRNELLHSIESVASDLISDLDAVIAGDISKTLFLEKYGHLRPGTYDITSLRYDENYDQYFGTGIRNKATSKGVTKEKSIKSFRLTSLEKKNIESLIEENEFSFNVEQLFNFIHASIIQREYSKFEFTKTVSSVLKMIVELGEIFSFTREDMAFVDINTIIDFANTISFKKLEHLLSEEIKLSKYDYDSSLSIKLPYIINSLNDIYVINIPTSRPNFVTLKKVIGSPVLISSLIEPRIITGKIVMIESADPGFDWIFAHNISGLITMFGGAASHMTIRANEFGIPAAIGCGEELFNQLIKSNSIELNCAGKYVISL